jgi:hypothetical protein
LARGDCHAENASTIFDEKVKLGDGRIVYPSDHLGLRATLAFGPPS